MGEQNHALHEIADARARMSELADELARHAKPEHVKEIAAEKVSEWKERAKERASEKASEIKTHAKEAVMQRTMEVKERVDTPRGWSLLGAVLGAGVGAILMKKAFTVRQERHIGQGRDEFRYRGERYATGMSGDIDTMGGPAGLGVGASPSAGVDLKERASDVAQTVKDKASELKDRAMGAVDQVRDQASHLRERIPSGTELKGRTTSWFDRALEDQPVMLALGSIALGVFTSLFIPVTSRERQLIEPAKRKAQESLSQLGEQLEQRIQGQEEGQGSDISSQSRGGGSSYQGDVGAMRSSTLGSTERSEELMGAERPGFSGSDRAESLASPTGSRIPPTAPLDDVSTKIH
jgi:ElaB/YqjD/DUF883 family membrane-anchored ribosome-binding protein